MSKVLPEKLWVSDNGDGTYTNPILYTDYSDPDVVRVGADYFMIASSFCNSPAVPVLHSKDLVNWKMINYIIDKIPFERYDKPAHGCGTWAPAIRYHNNLYYAFIPMPDEGIFVSTTVDPRGKWSQLTCVHEASGWIDPCPFWDDDGKVYMVSAFARSRIGFKSILNLAEMNSDAMSLLDEGRHIYDGNATQETIEGPKLHKRNGYYYIFAPAGGVATGWQTILRSKNIWGPYEEKIVMHQGNTIVNGPHQGAWIDTPTGEDWFVHFQDIGSAGRITHLQPMYWENDWPVIGVNPQNGCGEPAIIHEKPNVGGTYPIQTPEDSDLFDNEKLGLQWQWNANYKDDWYKIDKESQRLILNSQNIGSDIRLCDVPNLLLQKWTAPDFKLTTKLNLKNLGKGDTAGLVSLGGEYTGLEVSVLDKTIRLAQITGELLGDSETNENLELVEAGDEIYLRMTVENAEKISFSYSLDNKDYHLVGKVIKAVEGRWVGVKVGLFAVNKKGSGTGSLAVDYFVFEKR